MKTGNWIALHKELKYFLPHGRSYTLLEAVFSYTLDIDNSKEGTISGYSKLWGWSRTKVRKFIEELKTDEGHLTNRQETGKRHQILLKLNNLQNQKDSRKTDERHLKDSQVDTTIKPNPKPNPKVNIYEQKFLVFWKEYPKKKSKGQAEKAWLKIKPTQELFIAIMGGLEKAKNSREWENEEGQFIPYPASWLNAKGWEDEYKQKQERKFA